MAVTRACSALSLVSIVASLPQVTWTRSARYCMVWAESSARRAWRRFQMCSTFLRVAMSARSFSSVAGRVLSRREGGSGDSGIYGVGLGSPVPPSCKAHCPGGLQSVDLVVKWGLRVLEEEWPPLTCLR